MTSRRGKAGFLLAWGALLGAGCSDAGEAPASAAGTSAPGPAVQPSPVPARPLAPGDFPALSSRDCTEVVQFYLEAIGGREYDKAALVWNDPAIDGPRLRALFGDYREPQFEWTEPLVEGAAGSLYCTVGGTLSDALDPARPAVEGTLTLRRVNDVPGATPAQLRWTLRSSTFVAELGRSDGA